MLRSTKPHVTTPGTSRRQGKKKKEMEKESLSCDTARAAKGLGKTHEENTRIFFYYELMAFQGSG